MSPEIPSPPVMTNEPVVLDVDASVLVNDTIPVKDGEDTTENAPLFKARLVPAVYTGN